MAGKLIGVRRALQGLRPGLMSRYLDAASTKYLREGKLTDERAQALGEQAQRDWRSQVAERRQGLREGHATARATQRARQDDIAASGRAAATYRRAEETAAYETERFLLEKHARTQQRISQRAAASSAREIADFMQALKSQAPPPEGDPTEAVIQRARARRLAAEENARTLKQEREGSSDLFNDSRILTRGSRARAPISASAKRSTRLQPAASTPGPLGQIVSPSAGYGCFPALQEESSSDIDLPARAGGTEVQAGPGETAAPPAGVPGLTHVSLTQELSYLRERAGMEREDKARQALAATHSRLLAENAARDRHQTYLNRARDVDDLISLSCELCDHDSDRDNAHDSTRNSDTDWTKVLWERYLSCQEAPDVEYRNRCATVALLASEEVGMLLDDFVNDPGPEEMFLLQQRLLDDALNERDLTQGSGPAQGQRTSEGSGNPVPDGQEEQLDGHQTSAGPHTFLEFVQGIPTRLQQTAVFKESREEPPLVDLLRFRLLPRAAASEPSKEEAKTARSGSKSSKRAEPDKRPPGADSKPSSHVSARKGQEHEVAPQATALPGGNTPEGGATEASVYTGTAIPLFTLVLYNAAEVSKESLAALADSLSLSTGGLTLSLADVVSDFSAYREEYLRFNSQLLTKVLELEKGKGKKKEGAASPTDLIYVFNDRFASLPVASSSTESGLPSAADFDKYLKVLQAPYKDTPPDSAVYAVLLARVNYMLRRRHGLPIYFAESTEFNLTIDFGRSVEEVQAKTAALEAERAEASLSLRRKSRNAYLARVSALSAVSDGAQQAEGRRSASGAATERSTSRAGSTTSAQVPMGSRPSEDQGRKSQGHDRLPCDFQSSPTLTPNFVLFLLPYKTAQSVLDIEAAFAGLHSLRSQLDSKLLGVTLPSPKQNPPKGSLVSSAFDRVVCVFPQPEPIVVRSDGDDKAKKDAKKKDAQVEAADASLYSVWEYEKLKSFALQSREDPELQKVHNTYSSVSFGLDGVFGSLNCSAGDSASQDDQGGQNTLGSRSASTDVPILGLLKADSSQASGIVSCSPEDALAGIKAAYAKFCVPGSISAGASPATSPDEDSLVPDPSSQLYNLASVRDILVFCYRKTQYSGVLPTRATPKQLMTLASSRVRDAIAEYNCSLRSHLLAFEEMMRAFSLHYVNMRYEFVVSARTYLSEVEGEIRELVEQFVKLGISLLGQTAAKQPQNSQKAGATSAGIAEALAREQYVTSVSDFRKALEQQVNAWRAGCDSIFWRQRGQDDSLALAEGADAGLATAVASGDYSGKTSPLFEAEKRGFPGLPFLPAYFDYSDISTKYRFVRPLGFLLRAADQLSVSRPEQSDERQQEKVQELSRELEKRYGPLGMAYIMEQDLPEGYGSPAELGEDLRAACGDAAAGQVSLSQGCPRPHTYTELMTNCLLISFRAIVLDTVRLFATAFYSLVNLIYTINDQEHHTEAASEIESSRIVSGRDSVADRIKREVGPAIDGLPMGHEVGRGDAAVPESPESVEAMGATGAAGTAGLVGASNGALAVLEARKSAGIDPPDTPCEQLRPQSGSQSSRAGSRTGHRPGSRAAPQSTALGPQLGCGLTRIRREDLDYETFCDEFLSDISLSLSTRPLFAISKGQASWVWGKQDDDVCKMVVDLVENYHSFMQSFVYKTAKSLVKGIQLAYRQTQIRCNDVLTAQYLSLLGDVKRLCGDLQTDPLQMVRLLGATDQIGVSTSQAGTSAGSSRPHDRAPTQSVTQSITQPWDKVRELGLFRGETLDRERTLLEYALETLKRLPHGAGEQEEAMKQPAASATAGEVARLVLPADMASRQSSTLLATYLPAVSGEKSPLGFSLPVAEMATLLSRSTVFAEAYGADGLNRDEALRLPEDIISEVVHGLPLDSLYAKHNTACLWSTVLRQGALESISEQYRAFLEEQQASKKKPASPQIPPDNDYSLIWPAFLLQTSMDPLTVDELGFFVSQFQEVCEFDVAAYISAEASHLQAEKAEAEAAAQTKSGARSSSSRAAPKTARTGQQEDAADGPAVDTPVPQEPVVVFGETEEYRRLRERFLDYSLEGPFSRDVLRPAGESGECGDFGEPGGFGESGETGETMEAEGNRVDRAAGSEDPPAAEGHSTLTSALTTGPEPPGNPTSLRRPETFWRRYNMAARVFVLDTFAPLSFDPQHKDLFIARLLACLCFDKTLAAVDAKVRIVLGLEKSNDGVLRGRGSAAFLAAKNVLSFGLEALEDSLAKPLLTRNLSGDLKAAKTAHLEAVRGDLSQAIQKATADYQKASKGKKTSK